MATIYGTYSCGHEGQVYFPGSRKAVEWRAEREFERVCPECQAIENEKEASALREKYGAADADLPMLKGTDKQILWAEKIRNKFREEVRSFTSKKSYSDDEMIIRIAIDQILEIASAKWWIENKDAATRMIKKYASANIDEIKAELARDPSMIPQTAEASPARLSTPTVAEVIFTDNDVKLKSDKDSVIREVARKYHMNWSGTAWVFEISSISGSPRDRAVELGNLLLCAGVPIRMPDQATLDAAINGDYVPRHENWIVREDDDHVRLVYPRSDEIYSTAKRLPGAKWVRGTGMVIPATSVDEILDFAEQMDFEITKRAMALLEAATEAKHSRLVVSPAAPAKQKTESEELAEILASSRDVIPDLKDD